MPSSDYRRFLSYFAPLAAQSMAQSLTYPLMAMVASRGPGGPLNMAGLSQASAVTGLIWTLGAGLITAGMIYGRTREGFARYRRINHATALAVGLVYALAALPAPAHLIFGALMGLPPSIEQPARTAFLASLPLTLLFYLRNPYQVALFNGQATGLALGATVGRVLLTLLLAPLFCLLDAVGPFWAVVGLTLPVALEVLVSRRFAQATIAALPIGKHPPPRYLEMLFFALTLSLGGLFLALSGFMVGAFVARAPEPERTLPAYYMAMGLAGPVAFAAARLQALMISFYGRTTAINNRLACFAAGVGSLLGLLPLVLLLPPLARAYYIGLQKLPAADLPSVRAAAMALAVLPLAVAWRAYSEGKAAWLKKPVTVLTGQAVYLAMVTVISFCALHLGMPGHIIGAAALIAANLTAAGVVLLSMRWERRGRAIMAPTHPAPASE